MKIVQFQAYFGLLAPYTLFALCEDGSFWWAQPKQGKDPDWKRVKPPSLPSPERQSP